MPMTPLLDLPTSERYARGRYLIQCSGTGGFAIGNNRTAMMSVTTAAGDRFVVDGPFYFKNTLNCSITNWPEGLTMREGLTTVALGGGVGDPKIEPPSE